MKLRARTGSAATILVLTALLGSQAGSEPVGLSTSAHAVASAKRANSNSIDYLSRTAVRSAYLQRWLPATKVAMTPSGGSVSGCATYGTSAAQQQATVDAINFARGLVAQEAVRTVPKYDAVARQGALIMAANKNLSHNPPSSWSCWTKAGQSAAGRSNLQMSSQPPSAARIAENYLDDAGSGNGAVGHRRWLMRPEATTIGSGNAHGGGSDDWFANDLYVFTFADDAPHASAKRFYSWPSNGWFPTKLEPQGRWSLSSSEGASFASAKVYVSGPDGRAVRVTRQQVHTGYADNTLVWDFATPPAAVSGRTVSTYHVTVTGIQHSRTRTLNYRVRLFDPTYDPSQPPHD